MGWVVESLQAGLPPSLCLRVCVGGFGVPSPPRSVGWVVTMSNVSLRTDTRNLASVPALSPSPVPKLVSGWVLGFLCCWILVVFRGVPPLGDIVCGEGLQLGSNHFFQVEYNPLTIPPFTQVTDSLPLTCSQARVDHA